MFGYMLSIAVAGVSAAFGSVVNVKHSFLNYGDTQSVVDVNCYISRATSNAVSSEWGLGSCSEIMYKINHDAANIYISIGSDTAVETDLVEGWFLAVIAFQVIGDTVAIIDQSILSKRSRRGTAIGATLEQVVLFFYIVAGVSGIFALNASMRLANGMGTAADSGSRTSAYVGPGAYVLVGLPLLALAYKTK